MILITKIIRMIIAVDNARGKRGREGCGKISSNNKINDYYNEKIITTMMTIMVTIIIMIMRITKTK